MYFRNTLCASLLFVNVLLAADNPFIGTWKMLPDKSTFVRGQELQGMTVSFAAEGGKIRRTASGTYVNGQALDEGGTEGAVLLWDGKPHIVREGRPQVVVTSTPVRGHTHEATMKFDGKLVRRTVETVSADGQTLTEGRDNYDSQGKKSKTVLIFEKQ
jgi:hypothetical protein